EFSIRINVQWTAVGTTWAEAMAKQDELEGPRDYKRRTGQQLPGGDDDGEKTPVAKAAEKYLANCEAVGKDRKTVRAYRGAIDSFVAHFITDSQKKYVEEVERQASLEWIRWLRKQAVP